MQSNREIVNKAVVATDALAAAGKLNPQQSDRFIDLVIDVTGLTGNARVVRMRGDQTDIDKINVGGRVALPKTEATATSVRRGVKTSKVELHATSVVVPFEISAEFMMDNLEGATVEDTIITMMATQFANDLEELYIDGNKLGPARLEGDMVDGGSASKYVKDTYIALQDGWLKLAAAAHVVDAGGANIHSNIFSKMINEMPDKWKRVRRNMRFLCSSDHEQNYRQTVASRSTAAGDVALNTTQNMTPFGVQLVPLPLLQSQPRIVEHKTLTGVTPVALLHKNISDVVVTDTNLSLNPQDPITQGTTGVTVDTVAGTIQRGATSTLADPVTVKVTYKSQGQAMLTEFRNLILGIGRDITIKKDEDIYADTNQYAIHARVATEIEEADAVVLAKNIGLD